MQYYSTKISRGGLDLSIGLSQDEIKLIYSSEINFRVSKAGVWPNKVKDERKSIFYHSEPLGVHLWLNDFFLLHANAININDKVYVFAGIPGRGKSTLAAALAQAGYKILSDDMAAVQFDASGTPMTRPGPQWIKIWPSAAEMLELPQDELQPLYEGATKLKWTREDLFQREPVPLGNIYVLQEPSSNPSLQPFSPAEAFMELIKYFPLPSQLLEGEAHAKYFQLTRSILDHTLVFAIGLPNHPKKIVPFLESIGILDHGNE